MPRDATADRGAAWKQTVLGAWLLHGESRRWDQHLRVENLDLNTEALKRNGRRVHFLRSGDIELRGKRPRSSKGCSKEMTRPGKFICTESYDPGVVCNRSGTGCRFRTFGALYGLGQSFRRKGSACEFIISGDESAKCLSGSREIRLFDWIENERELLQLIEDRQHRHYDSYNAKAGLYDEDLAQSGMPVFIDDQGLLRIPRGIVINWNIYALSLGFPDRRGVTYLLGTRLCGFEEGLLGGAGKGNQEKCEFCPGHLRWR